jgi:hypothetical protein
MINFIAINLGVDDQLPLRQATGQVGCQARKPLANEEWDGFPRRDGGTFWRYGRRA